MSIGNILGLLTYTVMARFYETGTLFYVSSAACMVSALLLWRMGREPVMTLERHSFSKILHEAESLLSPKPILHFFDVRRLKLPNPRKLTPLQLLLLAAFVHWLGINFWFVGQIPLMRELGLSDSLILALNAANGVAASAAFLWIAPRVKTKHKWLIERVVMARAGLILCWAALPIFLVHQVGFVFVFPLVISAAFNVLYAMIWLPMTNLAISQAPEDRKSGVVGQFISATSVAGAVGSALGGLAISAYGYSIGFIIASAIVMLSLPIISRIDSFDAS
jgi:MFS family permease